MRKLTFALLFVALTCTLHAQDLHFGVTAGPNFSTVKLGDADNQPQSVIGFNLGVFAEFPLADKFILQPELQFQRLGYKIKPNDEEEEYGYRGKTNYITLPVLAKYAITDKLKAGLGPYVSMQLSHKEKILKYSGMEFENGEDADKYMDVSDSFKKMDYGAAVDLSYQFVPKIGIGLRYALGLANIFKNDNSSSGKAHNRSFSIGLSYHIR